MQRLICFFRLVTQWICSQNQPICQPALLSNAIRRRLKSLCFCMRIVGFFLRTTLMNGLLLLVTGPADESKRTKRIQGWSRLNWLGGILIIASWNIHFNKLLCPLRPYAAFPIRCKVLSNFKIFCRFIFCVLSLKELLHI